MNKYHIHYHTSDGRIQICDSNPAPITVDGLGFLTLYADHHPDITAEKIDLQSLTLVKMTAPDQTPSLNEVKGAIVRELHATDGMANPPPDRPVAQPASAWLAYRQALRDLSKRRLSPAEMVSEWPMRPDGSDAIMHLRARIEG